MTKEDCSIIGKKFGRLTVIEYDHTDATGHKYYKCECDCGGRTISTGANLKGGHAKSCGCFRRDMYNISGQKFGRLTVLSFDHVGSYGHSYWLCECDCGNTTVVERSNLLNGGTVSCGCYGREQSRMGSVTHGLSNTRLYKIWMDMKGRCNNTHDHAYDRYGGRHITVCEEWDDFENFYKWAATNGYAPELTIDRIDNDDGYYPDNCRWVDDTNQANNRRSNTRITYNNETHTIAEWARIFNVIYNSLLGRIKRGDMSDFEEYFGVIDQNYTISRRSGKYERY